MNIGNEKVVEGFSVEFQGAHFRNVESAVFWIVWGEYLFDVRAAYNLLDIENDCGFFPFSLENLQKTINPIMKKIQGKSMLSFMDRLAEYDYISSTLEGQKAQKPFKKHLTGDPELDELPY